MAPVAPAAPAAVTPDAKATPPVAPPSALIDSTKPAASKEAPKTDETKAAELELKFADGVKLDDASLASFKGVAKELGLDSPKAQKLVDLYAGIEAARAKQTSEQIQTLNGEWDAELRADPVIGGTKYDAATALARKAMTKFGGEAFTDVVVKMGLENNPAVVRAWHAVGAAMAEDSIAGTTGAASGAAGNPQQALIDSMFPSLRKE